MERNTVKFEYESKINNIKQTLMELGESYNNQPRNMHFSYEA
jgi:hypothetical protein